MASLTFRYVSESPKISVLDSIIKLLISVCLKNDMSLFELKEHILSNSRILGVCRIEELREDKEILCWKEEELLVEQIGK